MSALDPWTVLKDDKPPPPPASIRPFNSETDLKVARYLVGASIMEPSSIANLRTLWTSFFLLVWAMTTHYTIVTYGGGWPRNVHELWKSPNLDGVYAALSVPWYDSFLSWLMVAPIICGPPVVLLAMFEMRHRGMFESEMSRAIGEEDMTAVEWYYGVKALKGEEKDTEGGRKGFWVLEYDNRIIGAIGLDGRKPGQQLTSITDLIPTEEERLKAKREGKKDDAETKDETNEGTTTATTESPYPLRNRKAKNEPTVPVPGPTTTDPSTLFIRRFATSAGFRAAMIEDDLLNTATEFAFSPKAATARPAADKVVITLRPTVQRGAVKKLVQHGFKPVKRGSKDYVEMDEWRKGVKKTWFSPVAKVLTAVWPLSLEWTTYVLEKKTWEARRLSTALPAPAPNPEFLNLDIFSGNNALIDLDALVSVFGPDQCSADAVVGIETQIQLSIDEANIVDVCACVQLLATASGQCIPTSHCPPPNTLTRTDHHATCTCHAPAWTSDNNDGCRCAPPYVAGPGPERTCVLPPSARAKARLSKKSQVAWTGAVVDAELDAFRCPDGERACPVGSGDGWECVDTTTSLDSCGGCLTDTGVNCLAIRGALGVSCVDSKCEVSSCFPGWRQALDGRCVRA
ncbi:acyl-CoA N-acyltransferase domain protein [Pseudohyphozyma bogoriensis]|nr:acyl-CoA N-acyltransferase domain protein [Pseudohyphozyma bogoriensis]